MRKLICGVIAFILGAALFAAGTAESKEKGGANKLQLNSLPRNQPRITDMYRWNDRIVVEADSVFYQINVDSLSSIPLFCPGGRTIVSLVTYKDTEDYAWCQTPNSSYGHLFKERGDDWGGEQIPDFRNKEMETEFRTIEKPVLFLASKENRILVTGKSIYLASESGWKKIDILPEEYKGEKVWHDHASAQHYLLFKNKVFLGYDHGEFGGGLLALDITTGKWEKIGSGGPVTSIVVSPKEELWVSKGLAHMGSEMAEITVFNGTEWSLFSKNHGYLGNRPNQWIVDSDNVNWPFEPASIEKIYFDQNGNLYVLTGSLGIIRYANSKWERITPCWNEHFYVSSFLKLSPDKFLLATYDAGVAVMDTKDCSVQPIKLATSFYRFSF